MTLEGLITAGHAITRWIGEHSNKLAIALRSFFYMGTMLHWWTLTVDQLVAIGACVEALLSVFVEANTVSKVRVGERITEEVEKRTGTGPGTVAGLAFLLMLGGAATGCAGMTPPPNLTPEATVAYQATRAVKALDVLRDAAIDANATSPPLVSEDVTRKVVLYHQATVKVIQASPGGWRPMASEGLKELERGLSDADKRQLGGYVALVRTVMEATR